MGEPNSASFRVIGGALAAAAAKFYHAHVLRTPMEVRHAVRFVRDNFARHHGGLGVDEYSSANPAFVMPRPTGWLLSQVRRVGRPAAAT
jgi:hypothetical protein